MLFYFFIITIVFISCITCKYFSFKENYGNNKEYLLAIVAIFKNEEDYLEEWLKHHINQGISHFFLYCNDDNIKKYDYLDKYKNYITLKMWIDVDKTRSIQKQAYEDCVKNDKYDFIGLLDIDEFYICTDNNKTVKDIISKLDKNNTKAVRIPRFNFGSNGITQKPTGNVLDSYLKHEKTCSSYKTIANTNFIDKKRNFYGVHDFPYIDKDGIIFNSYFHYDSGPTGCIKNKKNEIPIVINHYYTKSYNEYLNRCKLWENGGVNPVGYRKDCEKNFKDADKNDMSTYEFYNL